MTMKQLRAKLARANLTQLARETLIDVRTLRRIKHGKTQNVLARTMDALERVLR